MTAVCIDNQPSECWSSQSALENILRAVRAYITRPEEEGEKDYFDVLRNGSPVTDSTERRKAAVDTLYQTSVPLKDISAPTRCSIMNVFLDWEFSKLQPPNHLQSTLDITEVGDLSLGSTLRPPEVLSTSTLVCYLYYRVMLLADTSQTRTGMLSPSRLDHPSGSGCFTHPPSTISTYSRGLSARPAASPRSPTS